MTARSLYGSCSAVGVQRGLAGQPAWEVVEDASPADWLAALGAGAGQYVAATADPVAKLAKAEAELANARARGLAPERIRVLQANVAAARRAANQSLRAERSSEEWAALGKVLAVASIGFVTVATAAVAYRAARGG